ncbi:MAG: hypothetical protein ACFWT6_12160 [Virgibacillus proomii]|jgi:hypothetical protein
MKESFVEIFNVIKDTNLGIFLIAVLTFGITFVNFYRNRPSIKIGQLSTHDSRIIKPDFIDDKTPDVYWQRDYRVLVDVIITNKSAKPISIIEFVLNDSLRFNSYIRPGSSYSITVKPQEETIDGVIFGYGSSTQIIFSLHNKLLQPVVDIPPYTSVRGFLFFSCFNKDDVNIGKNELKIITSRKTFIKDVNVFDIEMSRLPLPDSIVKARNQHFE